MWQVNLITPQCTSWVLFLSSLICFSRRCSILSLHARAVDTSFPGVSLPNSTLRTLASGSNSLCLIAWRERGGWEDVGTVLAVLPQSLKWCRERGLPSNLLTMTFESLDNVFRRFYAEARTKKGEEYSRSASRHIMSISGHANEQSISSYNSRPSVKQLKNCSNILSNALVSK